MPEDTGGTRGAWHWVGRPSTWGSTRPRSLPSAHAHVTPAPGGHRPRARGPGRSCGRVGDPAWQSPDATSGSTGGCTGQRHEGHGQQEGTQTLGLHAPTLARASRGGGRGDGGPRSAARLRGLRVGPALRDPELFTSGACAFLKPRHTSTKGFRFSLARYQAPLFQHVLDMRH